MRDDIYGYEHTIDISQPHSHRLSSKAIEGIS